MSPSHLCAVTLHVENLREVQIAVAQGDDQEHELFWESYYFMDWDRIMLQEKALRQRTEVLQHALDLHYVLCVWMCACVLV